MRSFAVHMRASGGALKKNVPLLSGQERISCRSKTDRLVTFEGHTTSSHMIWSVKKITVAHRFGQLAARLGPPDCCCLGLCCSSNLSFESCNERKLHTQYIHIVNNLPSNKPSRKAAESPNL